MVSVRFTDVQAHPAEFLDVTSVTLEELQVLVSPFEAAFHAPMAAWRLDGTPRTAPPVSRVPQLTLAQHVANQALHYRRLRIEHVHSSVQRCRTVKDRIHLWKQGIRALVMDICCALHHFRVRLTPWQPMV